MRDGVVHVEKMRPLMALALGPTRCRAPMCEPLQTSIELHITDKRHLAMVAAGPQSGLRSYRMLARA